jgi:hypothetical protein
VIEAWRARTESAGSMPESQMRAVPSSLAVTTVRLSGLNATELIGPS